MILRRLPPEQSGGGAKGRSLWGNSPPGRPGPIAPMTAVTRSSFSKAWEVRLPSGLTTARMLPALSWVRQIEAKAGFARVAQTTGKNQKLPFEPPPLRAPQADPVTKYHARRPPFFGKAPFYD